LEAPGLGQALLVASRLTLKSWATHEGHEHSAKNAPFCGCFTLNMYVGILMNFQLQCVGVPNGKNQSDKTRNNTNGKAKGYNLGLTVVKT
jgi:hypothetical protein